MSETKQMDWCYSYDNEIFDSGSFSTREEALIDARENAEEGIEFAYLANSAPYSNYTMYPDADIIIEHMYCQADDLGGDFANDYPDCPPEAEKELTEKLHKLLDEWCEKYEIKPSFYQVLNSKEVKL